MEERQQYAKGAQLLYVQALLGWNMAGNLLVTN